MKTLIRPVLMLALAQLALLPLAGCNTTRNAAQTQPNASTPGWTGSTVVVGSNSTVAGDADATNDQQKWQRGRR